MIKSYRLNVRINYCPKCKKELIKRSSGEDIHNITHLLCLKCDTKIPLKKSHLVKKDKFTNI